MPLPAALQQRLMQRGLIKTSAQGTDTKKRSNEDDEEIIAESYDEPANDKSNIEDETNDIDKIFDKVSNCPNMTNPHHACNEYCIKKFGYKKFEPHPILEKRRIRMLKIYPLPQNWVEVPDIMTNRYYYWNTETNQVCWMSPSYPKAKIENAKKNKESKVVIEKSASVKSMNEKLDEFVDDLDNLVNSYQRNTSKPKQTSHKKPKQSNNFDPMDPSSYSDIPRGKWSDGLDGS